MTSAVAHLLLVLMLALLATVPTQLPLGDFPSVVGDADGSEPEDMPGGDALAGGRRRVGRRRAARLRRLSDSPPDAALRSALGPIKMELAQVALGSRRRVAAAAGRRGPRRRRSVALAATGVRSSSV